MTISLLWDHDGVLVDTERLYFQATREALAQVGVTLSEEIYRQFLLVEGTGAWHLAEERGVPEAKITALKAQRNQRYTALLTSQDVVIPGIPALLSELATRHRMAIVTSSQPNHFHAIHRNTDLTRHFELVLTRDCYVDSKPSPEPYLTALTRMQLTAAQCLVIEDSERGLRAARAAGIRCWAIPSELTRASSFEGAERVFDGVASLAAALRALP